MKMLREKESWELTFIRFWIILGLFFGLGGSFFPTKAVKYFSISSINKETENFSFWESPSPHPLFLPLLTPMILVCSSPSSLQAACLVLRFHGGVSATPSSPPFLKVDNFGFPSHNISSCSLPFQDHQYGGSAYRPSCISLFRCLTRMIRWFWEEEC